MPLSNKEKVELLRRIPLFAECSKAELTEVAISADEREAPEGDRLTEEGRPGREFFILVEGAVDVRRGGKKLGDLGAGDWFGEMAILRYKPRAATVTATTPVRAPRDQRSRFPASRGDDAADCVESASKRCPTPRQRRAQLRIPNRVSRRAATSASSAPRVAIAPWRAKLARTRATVSASSIPAS